jgi:hypothetical protein
MLRRLGLACILGALLFGRPSVAENQKTSNGAATYQSGDNKRTVPPPQVAVEPMKAAPASHREPSETQGGTADNPMPRFGRPEWLTVYITAGYVFIAWLTLRAIKRQADIMQEQARDARSSSSGAAATAQQTLDALQRQANTMERQASHLEFQVQEMRRQAYQMGEQAEAAHKSAEAAQQSAEAALLNARAFINSERGRLVVEYTRSKPGHFKFWARNSGRSSAHLLFSYIWMRIIPKGETFPITPSYIGQEEESLQPEEWINADRRHPLLINDALEEFDLSPNSFLFSDSRADLIRGDKAVWVYGYLRYRDSVSGDGSKLTRFCYRVYWIDGRPDLLESGRSVYRMET